MTSSSNHDPIAVELVGATKLYGALRAADAVSLQIRHGEFFTVLGSSGSGKTTTLRLIGGFELPDEGRVLIDGQDVSRLQAYKRDVHTVFQDYALFPHLNVFENVAFAPRLKGRRRADLQKDVGRALELVQLTGLEKRKPAQLSGGQQQRVALARAVVDRPAVLLLDEPLSALDAKIRSEVREELKLLQRDTGITFVYVTHDQEEALTMSDRIAVMRGGKVLQVGSSIDIYEHPTDLFVASFIGKANFLPGVLVDATGGNALGRIIVDGRIVEATLVTSLPASSKVRVMIRPENMRVTPVDEAPGAAALVERENAGVTDATIRTATYLGHATEYLLTTPRGPLRSLDLRRRGAVPLAEGTRVTLSWSGSEALAYREE